MVEKTSAPHHQIIETDRKEKNVGENIVIEGTIDEEMKEIILTGDFKELVKFLRALDNLKTNGRILRGSQAIDELKAAKDYSRGIINNEGLWRAWSGSAIQLNFGMQRVYLKLATEISFDEPTDTEPSHLVIMYLYNDAGDPEECRRQHFEEIKQTYYQILEG